MIEDLTQELKPTGGYGVDYVLSFNAKVGLFVLKNISSGEKEELDSVELLYVARASQNVAIVRTKDKIEVRKSQIHKKVQNLEKIENAKLHVLFYSVLLDRKVACFFETKGSVLSAMISANPKPFSVLKLKKGELAKSGIVEYYTVHVEQRNITDEENNDEELERIVRSIVEFYKSLPE